MMVDGLGDWVFGLKAEGFGFKKSLGLGCRELGYSAG